MKRILPISVFLAAIVGNDIISKYTFEETTMAAPLIEVVRRFRNDEETITPFRPTS
jgi:hypothetical protein